MYIPAPFKATELALIHDMVEEIRFGSLITAATHQGISHIPFLLDRERGPCGTLIGHVARANPHWQTLQQAEEILVAFVGPNTYISPSWYASAPRAPTWNYVAIHLTVRCTRLVTDAPSLRDLVTRLSDTMEPRDSGWKVDMVSAYVDKLIGGIVGFELEAVSVESQFRLAQQNDMTDRRRVHDALASGSLRNRQVAELMERFSL